jgi:hypothetical protein
MKEARYFFKRDVGKAPRQKAAKNRLDYRNNSVVEMAEMVEATSNRVGSSIVGW